MIFRRFRSMFTTSYRKIFPNKVTSSPVTLTKTSQTIAIPVREQLTVPPASPSAASLKSSAVISSAPVVDEPVNQDKRFKKTVITEMMTFRQSVEHLATSDAGIADGWLKRIGFGAFTAGITVLNTGIGLLAAFGVLLAPVSAGIALGISLFGIVGAIGLNIYLNYRERNTYKRADKFMERDNIEDDMGKIADALTVVLREQLTNCTRNEADILAKASCAVISKAILKGNITSFELLQSPESLKQILAKYASYAPSHKFQATSAGRKSQSTHDILRGLVKDKVTPVVNIKRSVADVSSTAEEREPLLATVSGQSMFAVKGNAVQARRFAPVPPTTPSPRRMG